MSPIPYWRRVAADRWVAVGTPYALALLPSGTYQFFSSGRPVFTVASLTEADQALDDVATATLDLHQERL